MNEVLLSFLWQHQYFSHTMLTTETGAAVQVHHPGFRNTDAGPDFYHARIEIDGLLWAGMVELHVRTSDWVAHGHHTDKAYRNVILHVVWENDLPPDHSLNHLIPALCLKKYVDPMLPDRYRLLLHNLSFIPCSAQFGQVSYLQKTAMLSRVLAERLERKIVTILAVWDRTGGDWNETAWQWLARYYGFKVNADTFQKLAERLPLKLMLKHRDSPLQLEALLFGTAGLIPASKGDEYTRLLRREFRFLATKYKLQRQQLENHEWRFLRLRPSGFPTVRLAQLARLVHKQGSLFSALTTPETVGELEQMFRTTQSEYWQQHYYFGTAAKTKVASLGREAAHLLIINVVVPLLAAHAARNDCHDHFHKSLYLLEQLPPENNRYTRQWEDLGMPLRSASDSQGLIEWLENYCSRKKCLSCTVGNTLLRSGSL